jgi:hypothetical protein
MGFFKKKRIEKPEKKEEHKECEHEECAECHHLIAKFSGQRVIELNYSYPIYGLSFGGSYEREMIFCDLHKKPYDKYESAELARYNQREQQYWKQVEPWQKVNADGTPLKEKSTK